MRDKLVFTILVTIIILFGIATFGQAQKPESTGLKDLWDSINELEEDIEDLKAEEEPKYEIYMSIPGIGGEATDEDHKDWIEVIGYSHEIIVVAGAGGGGGAGGVKPQLSDFTVSKYVDRASPAISVKCCQGQRFKQVIIDLCYAGGDKDTYMEYDMRDVTITSVSPTGDPLSGEDRPTEDVTFSFGRIYWRYTYTDPDTNTVTEYEHYWDVNTNSGG